MKRLVGLAWAVGTGATASAADFRFSGTVWFSDPQTVVPIGQAFSGFLHLDDALTLRSETPLTRTYGAGGFMSFTSGALSFSRALDAVGLANDVPQSSGVYSPPYGYLDQVRVFANDPQYPADQNSLGLTFSSLTTAPGGMLASTAWPGGLPLDGWGQIEFNGRDAATNTTVNGHVLGIQAVPEPATLAALGLGALGAVRRRGKRRA